MKTAIYIALAIILATSAFALSTPCVYNQYSYCNRPSIHTTLGYGTTNYRIPYYAYTGQQPYVTITPQIPEHAADEYLQSDASLRDKESFVQGYEEGYSIAGDLKDQTSTDPYADMQRAYTVLKQASGPRSTTFSWGFEAGYYDGANGKRTGTNIVRSTLQNEYIKQQNAREGGIYWNNELWKSDKYIGLVQKTTSANTFWGFRYEKGLECNGKICTEVNVFY